MPPPLYAARVSDLLTGRSVAIACECGHVSLVPTWIIRQKLPEHTPVRDIGSRCRCRRCQNRGRVTVDVMRALGYRPDR